MYKNDIGHICWRRSMWSGVINELTRESLLWKSKAFFYDRKDAILVMPILAYAQHLMPIAEQRATKKTHEYTNVYRAADDSAEKRREERHRAVKMCKNNNQEKRWKRFKLLNTRAHSDPTFVCFGFTVVSFSFSVFVFDSNALAESCTVVIVVVAGRCRCRRCSSS